MSSFQPYQEKLKIPFVPNGRSGMSVVGSAINQGWLIFCCGFKCYSQKELVGIGLNAWKSCQEKYFPNNDTVALK